MSKKTRQNEVEAGECTFSIIMSNQIMLRALSKYAMMLDYVTQATESEQLNVDGLVNSLLSEALTRSIKGIVTKYGFTNAEDFLEAMDDCRDGEEVAAKLKEVQRAGYQQAHDKILAFIPMEDSQMSIDDFIEKHIPAAK